MTENTKTLLIVGGVALVGWLLYKKVTAGRVSPTSASSPGIGQNVQSSTGIAQGTTSTGSADFWSTLGNVGQGLNGAVSSVESTYNGIYDLFGGQPSSTGTGQGNNGTAG